MDDRELVPIALSIHAEFGPIYRNGEFVQQGSVLGLAVNARKVVIAPVSGWVRLPPDTDNTQGITVELHPRPPVFPESPHAG